MRLPPEKCPGPLTASEHGPLLADLFHALNQPLTMLCCSLELALYQPRSLEQYRENVREALERAEQVTQLAAGIRRLVEAEDPGEDLRALTLESGLREAIAGLVPLAESARVGLVLRCDSPGRVHFESHRLRQALFLLLESTLSSSPAGAAVEIYLTEAGDESVLTVTTIPLNVSSEQSAAQDDPEWNTRDLNRRLGLAIARRMFEAAGGRFRAEEDRAHRLLEVRLPRVAPDVV